MMVSWIRVGAEVMRNNGFLYALGAEYKRKRGVQDNYKVIELKFERIELLTAMMDKVAGEMSLGISGHAV